MMKSKIAAGTALPALKYAYDAAVEAVLEHGRTTHCETAIALSENGDVLFEKEGTATMVEFEQWHQDLLKQHTGAILIHNHPTHPYSLSTLDLTFAAASGIEIWAVTEDGGRYGATIKVESGKLALCLLFLGAWGPGLIEQHAVCQAAANAGLIEYYFTLGAEMHQALQRKEMFYECSIFA